MKPHFLRPHDLSAIRFGAFRFGRKLKLTPHQRQEALARRATGEALVEIGFFHTLKTELVHHRKYATKADAQRDLFAFIEGFYNRMRLHSAIGYISPVEMERKAI